ncbi:hypothetical protein Tco_0492067 [Tanacetum coccineum]
MRAPLTRITTTNEVPSRKPIVLESESPKPVVNLVYSRKPRKNKNTESFSKTEDNSVIFSIIEVAFRNTHASFAILKPVEPDPTIFYSMCPGIRLGPTEKHLNAMRINAVSVKIHSVAHLVVNNLLGDNLVSWSSKRQKSATISSTEAEYIALSDIFTKALAEKGMEFSNQQAGRIRSLWMMLWLPPGTDFKNGRCIRSIKLRSVTSKDATLQRHNEKFEEPPLEKEILAFLSQFGHTGKIPSQPKASKKKANSDATTKQKPPTVPKEKKGKKTGKGKQKAKELETISEAILTPEMKNWCFTRGTVALIMNSDDDDLLEVNDNEVEGVDVEGEKSDEDATYVEDQGNEADRDTNANLEGRDDVMADVVLVPRFKQPMKLKTLMYPISVNPDGHNKSSLYHLLRSQHLNPRSRYRVERYLDIMLKLPL